MLSNNVFVPEDIRIWHAPHARSSTESTYFRDPKDAIMGSKSRGHQTQGVLSASHLKYHLIPEKPLRHTDEVDAPVLHSISHPGAPVEHSFNKITGEDVLRRKTPSGTLNAGYHGSLVGRSKRSHGNDAKVTAVEKSGTIRTNSGIDSTISSCYQDHQCTNRQRQAWRTVQTPSSARSYKERSYAASGLAWGGMDSVLNQYPIQNASFTVPTSTFPSIFNPTWPHSSQHPSAAVPAWIHTLENEYCIGRHAFATDTSEFLGATSPVNPSMPACCLTYQTSNALVTDSTCAHSGNDLHRYVMIKERQAINQGHQYPTAHEPAPFVFQNRPSLISSSRSQTAPMGSIASANCSRNSAMIGPTNAMHFNERVLEWASKSYATLVLSLEQNRRSQDQASPKYPPPSSGSLPCRPYPTWSGRQGFSQAMGPSHKLPYVPLSRESISKRHDGPGSFATPLDNHFAENGTPLPSLRPWMSTPISKSSPQSPWSPFQSKYSLPNDEENKIGRSTSPIAKRRQASIQVVAAENALDMLSKMCQESQWKWMDGMILAGCLAYGLRNYSKAMKWFSKALSEQPDDVEAISNLAATLFALGRSPEAERYWMRAMRLQPSYLEAAEHLVGLLHENNRCEEVVEIIGFLESALMHRNWQAVQISQAPTQHSPRADNGRLIALIHGKGNILYQAQDNLGAAASFESAVLIAASEYRSGIQNFIHRISRVLSESYSTFGSSSNSGDKTHEPILLPPEMALATARLVFPPHGELPGLQDLPAGTSRKAAISVISNSLLSLAKIFQDNMTASGGSGTAPRSTTSVGEILALYYLSLSLQPSPSTANNVGILLASVQQSAIISQQLASYKYQGPSFPGVQPGSGIALALAYYDYGLKLDSNHAHLYTNLGSLFKDIGQLSAAIKMYEKAVECDGNFDIALANLANAVKDKGNLKGAIEYYRRAVNANPGFTEAVCGLANALNSVCCWKGRGGVSLPNRLLDRWHVNEQGLLYDASLAGIETASSGWMKRVVTIVNKQLIEGENWGNGCLKYLDALTLLTQLGVEEDGASWNFLKRRLLEASGKLWEGARLVRLVERATKLLTWRAFRKRYLLPGDSTACSRVRPSLPTSLAVPSAPTVLPFHTFTCPLSAAQIRKISQRNGLRVSCSTLRAAWLPTTIYEPPPPPQPHLNVGYVSSDFNNHPLAHLMQSVFGMHDPSKVKAICYATTASDGSVHRAQIERECSEFRDASSWPIDRLVEQIVRDEVHILVNLNGYTRGAKNEVFAARPAPIQMSFMGFAGTLGAEWCDYLLADRIAIPPSTLRPYRRNVDLEDQMKDANFDTDQCDWVYGENIIYTRDTFFCCDHKQSAPDARTERLVWSDEQRQRWRMRKELFPNLPDDTIILGNFNQLYKMEPTTFRTWLRILSRVPKAVLWLLRFPELGEHNLRQTALQWGGAEVAARIIFTDVAPKNQHISRARICDLFLDTPECNAHTTAADVLWSGTPLLTYPRYDYKMCSRIAASILRGALPKNAIGERVAEELIVDSDDAYEEHCVHLANEMTYADRDCGAGSGKGKLMEMRKTLYEARWSSALFDTARWVEDVETAYTLAWQKWVTGEGGDIWL